MLASLSPLPTDIFVAKVLYCHLKQRGGDFSEKQKDEKAGGF